VLAFLPGWRRHGSRLPPALGTVGVTLLIGGAFGLIGLCCATCQVDRTEVLLRSKNSFDSICLHCVHVGTPVAISGGHKYEKLLESADSKIAAWLAPLGGTLLIAGHLANRRCSCGCCNATVKPPIDVPIESPVSSPRRQCWKPRGAIS
jgi:hypothetical protein